MKTKLMIGATLLAMSTMGSAMPVSEFVPRATALEKKGAMAIFAGDFRILKSEVNSATQIAVKEEQAAVQGGGKASMCLPMNGRLSLGTSEVLNYMRAVPAAQSGMSVKDAMAILLRKKFPCLS